MQIVILGYTRDKLPGLDGLLYDFPCHMSKLFGYLLAIVYRNRQQNGSISSFGSRRTVTLLKRDPNKGNVIDNFQPNTLFKVGLKFLAQVLAERLALAIGKLVDKGQTCAIPRGSIHLHALHHRQGS